MFSDLLRFLRNLLGIPSEPVADASGHIDVSQLTWIRVVSTNVRAIAYLPRSQRMYVEFGEAEKPSRYYEYEGVPEMEYRWFLQALSKGQFVWRVIRNYGADRWNKRLARYKYRRVYSR